MGQAHGGKNQPTGRLFTLALDGNYPSVGEVIAKARTAGTSQPFPGQKIADAINATNAHMIRTAPARASTFTDRPIAAPLLLTGNNPAVVAALMPVNLAELTEWQDAPAAA